MSRAAAVKPGMTHRQSYLTRIRGIDLLPGETVGALLDCRAGLLAEPGSGSRIIIATNRRVISVAQGQRASATEMFAAATVSAVAVRDESRRRLSGIQGTMLIIAGALIYLALAYWLVDRLPGPIIPVINLHVAAAALLLITVIVIIAVWRSMSQPAGRSMQLRGANWTLDVPTAAPRADLLSFAGVLLEMSALPSVCAYSPAGAASDSGSPNGSDGSMSSDKSSTCPR